MTQKYKSNYEGKVNYVDHKELERKMAQQKK